MSICRYRRSERKNGSDVGRDIEREGERFRERKRERNKNKKCEGGRDREGNIEQEGEQ